MSPRQRRNREKTILAKHPHHSHHRRPGRWIYWSVGVILVLIGVRLALPYVLKAYVNHDLNKSHDYTGSVGSITVALWRGAYQIHEVNILKRNFKIPVPFFSAALIDLSVQWNELFHGKIVSEITMKNAHLNFVSGPTAGQSQSGVENNWAATLESLAPFKINSLVVTNSQIHFENPYSVPPVDVYMMHVFGVATNLTNARNVKQALPAGVSAVGKTLGQGRFYLQCNLNPLAKTPTFQLNASITNVDLLQLNDFLDAYGKFKVASGDFALFTSFAAADGKYDGYFKVFFKNLDVFQWQKEKKEDILQVFWDAIVGTVADIFKNQPHNQLATKVPITGTFNKTDVHLWPTIQTLLRNAFVRALLPKFDQRVTTQNAKNITPPPPGPPAPLVNTNLLQPGQPQKPATIQMLGTNQLQR